MKINIQCIIWAVAAALFCSLSAQAAVIFNSGARGDRNWSTTGNWKDGTLPGPGDDVQLNNANFIMDTNATVKAIYSSFGTGSGTSTSAGGTLTVDINSGSAANGIYSAYNKDDAIVRLEFDGNITIQNSGGLNVNTIVGVKNERDNATLAFGANSVLTLKTRIITMNTGYGNIEFNGMFGSSDENLLIASDNVSFGIGHDSSSFGKDIIFQAGAKLAVNGGTVLNSNRKLQVNGSGELELNGENAINDMNISMANLPNLLIDANASQDDMGFLKLGDGTVTLDLAPGVSIAFDDSSAQTWGTGILVISNFTPGVVSFSNAGGLDAEQLAQIQAYDGSGTLITGLSIDATGALIP